VNWQRIGFIGVGLMGGHMAGHLVGAGYPVTAFDVDQAALDAVVAKGAKRAASSAEAAPGAAVVVTMAPVSPHVEAAALGSGGIIESAREGMVHIGMSTIAPATSIRVAQKLGKRGVRCLDTPVSSGETGAMNATLSIMVGGPMDLFDEILPLLEITDKTVTHCGENGAGQTAKSCNQRAQSHWHGRGIRPGSQSRRGPADHSQGVERRLRADAGHGPSWSQGCEGGVRARIQGPVPLQGPGVHHADSEESQRLVARQRTRTAALLLANGYGDPDHSAVVKAIEMLSNGKTGGRS
jgi:2-hydroxy-3-oxopropionate reductase